MLLDHRNITVVTNNLNIANILAANESCEVMVSGGALRRSDGGLTGGLAKGFMEQFKVDIAVIGASAIDADGDLLDFDLAEVDVSRTIIRRARRSFVVADASKLARSAPVRIGCRPVIRAERVGTQSLSTLKLRHCRPCPGSAPRRGGGAPRRAPPP